jgi:Catechol dioxygenase N terminus
VRRSRRRLTPSFDDWPPCLKCWLPPYSRRRSGFRGKYGLQRFKNLLAAQGARERQAKLMDTLQAETETSSETEKVILADVRARFETTENPRIRQLILGLIDHLHAFVREQKVTWSEWEYFMGFLARAAAVTKDGRNEFIALSDSNGISMQVLAASQPKPPGATIPTLIGPFFIEDAPVFPIGADIARGLRAGQGAARLGPRGVGLCRRPWQAAGGASLGLEQYAASQRRRVSCPRTRASSQ